jgi:hypothetical protein
MRAAYDTSSTCLPVNPMKRVLRPLIFAMVLSVSAGVGFAEECQVPGLGRGGDWVKIQELTRAFRCVINQIEDLKKQQRGLAELEETVAELLRRVPSEYINDNGRITTETDRVIGKASIILDSRRSGDSSSLPIEQSLIEELCSDRSCQISLSLQVFGVLTEEPLERIVERPCEFSYWPDTGAWFRSEWCHGEKLSGLDGDGSATSADAGVDIILETGQACLLSDADIKTMVGQAATTFARDYSKGLFLIAAPDRRPDPARPFKCVLEVYRTSIM